MRAAFVYPNARRGYAERVARGEAPDTQLLGQNHLVEHGIDARIVDSWLTRSTVPPLLQRPAWILRELTLPVEVGQVDVIFTGLANLLPGAARLRRLPTVVVNYGLNQIYRRASRARRLALGAVLRSAAAVVCFGDSQRAELAAWGVDSERVATVRLGVDEAWFAPRPKPDGPPLVLSVGKDLARDFATLARALEGLEVEAELVALPRNLAGVVLPRNVRARQVGIAELRELYARAACVVVPQHGDEFRYGADGGLTVLLEAMAMARPVVATGRQLVREYVEDGVDALLVPPGDPAALRVAIERVLGDAELARRLGLAGRERVERAHTTRGFAARLAPLLRSVVYPRPDA